MAVVGENDTVVTTATTTKKKKKSFGVVKRLFKRKKKRLDDESVFTVTEPPSIVRKESFIAPPTTTPKPIQIVLLLLDPTSQRFELLQLEFDANRAIVNDVLSQVHPSATEGIFRSMNYAGVCNLEGTEMIGLMKLVLFCRSNDVVIAIPDGMSAKDTAKLAELILFDPKVEEMVSGFIIHMHRIIISCGDNSKLIYIHFGPSFLHAQQRLYPSKQRGCDWRMGPNSQKYRKFLLHLAVLMECHR